MNNKEKNIDVFVPQLSVCCCTWNRPQMLGELIYSYLIQDYPPELRELIILDDGGQYENEKGDGWQLISFPRRFGSLGEKRNTCVSLTHPKSKFIVIADDDDIYLPHWLYSHAKNFERGAEWSFASSIYWSERNRIIRKWNYVDEGWIMHPAHAFRKDLFWRVGGYPHLACKEDYYLFDRFRRHKVEHKDALIANHAPYFIYRKNIDQQHLHTSFILLEQYQNSFNVQLPKATLKMDWTKDYIAEADAFEKSLK
jgi:glycosyltransferase involved in cell wall biosynthesis